MLIIGLCFTLIRFSLNAFSRFILLSFARMSTVLSLVILFSIASDCHPGEIDICSTHHVKRIFSGLGESGYLTAHNVTHNAVGSPETCEAEIFTCPSCIISLHFTYINLNCHDGSGLNLFLYNSCSSDCVRVTEPPYDDVSGASFCDVHPRRLGYTSKTRTVRVSLFYSRSHNHAFTMEYKTEPNRQLFVGSSGHQPGLNSSTGVITSPFFPSPYPRDIISEYILSCKKQSPLSVHLEDDFTCRINLVFTDFQLAAPSFLEFYEGSRRVYTATGASFRLPIVMTSTNSLKARFFASGHSSTGFKAVYSFHSENVTKKMMAPVTDCGGLVGDFGGTITMMNMVDSQLKLYYCIWLIQPWRSVLTAKTHLYLKVTAFMDFAGDAELQIRQGLTSESPLLETLRHPASQNFRQHIIPAKSGYYLSLRALFGPASHFAVTYAGFSLNNCFGVSEFLCRNFRCISKKLTCDGFDHCGDNSDEFALCYQDGDFHRGLRKWHTLTPNYYFPKMKGFSASLMFVISFVSLILLLLGLTGVVYRIGRRAQRQRDLQDQLQAISDLRDSFSDEVSVEDVVIDDPPSYEPPPNYEEVVKTKLNGSGL